MKLRNHTKFDTSLIREIIRFVCPPGVAGFDISVKNSSNGWKGRAYVDGCRAHYESHYSKAVHSGSKVKVKMRTPLVTIGVPARLSEKSRYPVPHETDYRKGYLRSVQFSPVEDIVHLIAHELRHLWQKRVPSGHRVWGARGQYSERDADAYAIGMVRKWRRRS